MVFFDNIFIFKIKSYLVTALLFTMENSFYCRKPVEAANYAAEKKLFVLLEKIHARYRGNKEVAPIVTQILNATKKT